MRYAKSGLKTTNFVAYWEFFGYSWKRRVAKIWFVSIRKAVFECQAF